MARFRAAKYLTCFYCGKRSGLKFDGIVRDFLCLNCDATNYLDENGEITDPPVATDREAEAVQYAAPQSPTPSQSDEIFCPTCLKNQHLFTKSLAQYFPDDPSDPDYPELERNYYRYRRNLEKRYPQVCSDCAERVEGRIRQAGYTAKTDHLRRMMDLGRGRRTRRRSKLDWVNTLGKSLWRAGFLLQMLWHYVMITQALHQSDDGMYDPDDQSTYGTVVAWLKLVTGLLPTANTLIQSSIRTGILAAWWNPHFVQVNRGFTRHLLGFTQWYSFQGLIIFFRFIFRGIVDVSAQTTDSGTAKLGAHVAMAAVMIAVYVLAGRSIRVDTTPLFATYNKPLVPKAPESPTQRRRDDSKTFSELVNDALDSTNATPQKPYIAEHTPSPQSSFSPARLQSTLQPAFGDMRRTETPTRRNQQLQYAEEMDWSPITPQHRAFKDDSASTPMTNKFGRTNDVPLSPPEAKSPFWYKVPAAPANPAQRLRNPVWSPAPRQEPAETGKVMFTRRGHQPTSSQTSIGSDASGGVEFKQPRFFAPQKDHDASSLADLLSQSFTLGQDRQGSAGTAAQPDHVPVPARTPAQTTGHPNLVSGILTVLLSTWLLVIFAPLPYAWETRLAALFVAGVVALRGTGDASHMLSTTTSGAALYVVSALSVAELAAICWVGSQVWAGQAEQVRWHGVGVLASMLGHQALGRVL